MTKIKDLAPGEAFDGFYAVYGVEERDFKDQTRGKFLSLEIGDSSGQTSAKWWSWSESGYSLSQFPVGSILKLRGTAEDYNGQTQVKISRLRPAEASEYTVEDFIRTSPQSEEEVIARINALREQVQNEHIKALIALFFDDEKIFAEYLRASAAERNHHAYIRGLAEHSCNVTEVAVSLAKHYPELDTDLLIFGGLFHDYGKIDSYNITVSIQYSLAGRLVDHISLADAEISRRAMEIEDFPEELLLHIRHLILSHHGVREYGSPVEPKTPEAMILNYADLIDSRMEMTRAGRDNIDPGGWSYVKSLRRNVFYGTPPVAGEGDSE
ncbi:HD domain-containing protein [Gemmatimonas aurantiaca]|nr:HD domain-containing protein [Gemmatimonas aurantiaca]